MHNSLNLVIWNSRDKKVTHVFDTHSWLLFVKLFDISEWTGLKLSENRGSWFKSGHSVVHHHPSIDKTTRCTSGWIYNQTSYYIWWQKWDGHIKITIDTYGDIVWCKNQLLSTCLCLVDECNQTCHYPLEAEVGRAHEWGGNDAILFIVYMCIILCFLPTPPPPNCWSTLFRGFTSTFSLDPTFLFGVYATWNSGCHLTW